MPLPRLVSPPPDSRMRPFEDREAEARLKLHILMARIRTALRTVMDGDAHPIPDWRRNIRDEMDQVLAHVGVCAAHGFRIDIPYLVKDMADMMYDLHGGPSPDDNTLPASINMDFNANQDRKILASTPKFCYWWEKPVLSEGEHDSSGSSVEDFPRVTREVTEAHFKAFWEGSTHVKRGGIKDRGRMNVDMKPPIPGLAPRPPPPMAAALETHLSPHADGSPKHACPSCTPLREALRQAYDQLLSAQTRIGGAIILGKEAIERSTARVGVYEILDRIHRDHGIPFQDGRSLPEQYTNRFPLHKYEDGIEKGAQGRAAMGEHTLDAEAAMQSASLDGSHGHPGHCADTTSSHESTEESDESFPSGYAPPRSSEQSEDECSENPWDGESDNNRDWEMDPQALSGSDIGRASAEDTDDHLGLEEEKEDNECDEESDENCVDEDGSDEDEDDEDGSDQDEDDEDGIDQDEDDEDGSDEDEDEQSGE